MSSLSFIHEEGGAEGGPVITSLSHTWDMAVEDQTTSVKNIEQISIFMAKFKMRFLMVCLPVCTSFMFLPEHMMCR